MFRILTAVTLALLVSLAVYALESDDSSPRGRVEVQQLTTAERTGRVEVKELPPPQAARQQRGRVEVRELPAPETNSRPAVRKS